MNHPFADRRAAGHLLALLLTAYRDRPDAIVLALPRGGVLVARQIADSLHVPLDLLTVRKLGVPGHEEVAMGAIGAEGNIVLDTDVIEYFSVSRDEMDEVVRRERKELGRREKRYREGAPPPHLAGYVAILVDDGMATGMTMRAAVRAARSLGAASVVVAVPVASREAQEKLKDDCDVVISAWTPAGFESVGDSYDDFHPVTDAEVLDALAGRPMRGVRPGGRR